MQHACPNANCGAVYNLTPQHTGRTFVCKNCGWTLLVTATGLERAQAAPAGESAVQEARESESWLSRRGAGGEPFFTKLLGFFRTDVSTWLFRVGLFLAIICLFFALLDRAKVDRRKARIEAGDNKQRRLNDELKRKILEASKEVKDVREKFDAEVKARDKAQKEWENVERPSLQEDVDNAGFSARMWDYWYTWGMMWSFLFLGFGALGYLMPEQPTMRRIVGAIVLCSILVFIFIRYVFFQSLIRFLESLIR